ncbi:MAG: phosphodiester glycosidase family protein, partial [Polyangiaceae bacterium]|nr:phosphodiester glycosidase family protein [Polyangiaceae bacterium]
MRAMTVVAAFPSARAAGGAALVALAVGAGAACRTPPAPLPVPPPRATAPPRGEPAPAPGPLASAAPAASSGTASVPEPPPERPRATFPPASVPPIFPPTAKPDDGTWSPLPQGASLAEARMVMTTFHPDATRWYVTAVVVALDLERVALHWVPGTEEPKGDLWGSVVPPPGGYGIVPEGERARALAIFNGGFMFRHGRFGAMVGGTAFATPAVDACTVALYPDGRVRVRSHPVLEGEVAQMASYRQTPPCLVEQGVVNPRLPSEHATRLWGASQEGNREVRRSALGVDPTGRILYFGWGDAITATRLAELMRHVGAVDSAQLDINYSYTRFFLVDRSREPPQLG